MPPTSTPWLTAPDDSAALAWVGGLRRGKQAVVTLRATRATGVGSLPGTDVAEWCRIVAGELPELPHLPELPGRGPGADMIGRTLGMLNAVSPDFAATTTPTGWRISSRLSGSPRALRRSQSWLAEDLDAAEATWREHAGQFKIQLAGPITMAAVVESANGERLLADSGACRDLADALAHAAAEQVASAARRLPLASLIVQVDEPGLPAVLAGAVPVQSGWGRHNPLAESAAQTAIARVIASITGASASSNNGAGAGAGAAVHCCAPDVPVGLLVAAGAGTVSLDLTLPQRDEELGGLLESGARLMAGLELSPSDAGSIVSPNHVRPAAAPLLALLNRLGLSAQTLASQLVITPRCGLAGVSAAAARHQYELAAIVARAVEEFGERHG